MTQTAKDRYDELVRKCNAGQELSGDELLLLENVRITAQLCVEVIELRARIRALFGDGKCRHGDNQ